MTVADPYPQELLEDLDEPVAPVSIDAGTREIIRAINRLAQAVEQNTLALLDRPAPRPAGLAQLPPPNGHTQDGQANVCPIHGTPWKVVPAGISKKTGQPYDAFRACSTKGCDQRPR